MVEGKVEFGPSCCFESDIFMVRSNGDKEEELKTGWNGFDKTVDVKEGGAGGSQRWRRVKKEEKTIIGVNGLKIILTAHSKSRSKSRNYVPVLTNSLLIVFKGFSIANLDFLCYHKLGKKSFVHL